MAPRVKRSKELADLICERIAEGDSLRKICREQKMPGMSFVFSWLREDEEFAQQYTRAREAQADTLAEDILAIADDSHRDIEVTEDGREIPNQEFIARSRLRVDARKWLAGKMAPKKYGDKIGVEHSGTIELATALEAARKRVNGNE